MSRDCTLLLINVLAWIVYSGQLRNSQGWENELGRTLYKLVSELVTSDIRIVY